MDLDALEQDFHALSRRFHPDRFRTGLPRERVIALDHASLVNRGYRTLREPFERAAYLLKIEEGAGIEGNGSPPQELFEEILELQELLAEYRFAESDEQSRLKPRLVEMRCELEAVRDRGAARLIGPLFADWDAGARDRPVLLAEMRTILNERAYLRRALDSLAEVLSRS
jgi:molecular chaperone HscB